MAKKTCLRFENARVGTSEAHNRRVRKLDYIREDLSPQNEVWQECTISERLDLIHKTYFEAVHQKYQSSAHPIKEFVLVTDEKTTMENFADSVREIFHITKIRIFSDFSKIISP